MVAAQVPRQIHAQSKLGDFCRLQREPAETDPSLGAINFMPQTRDQHQQRHNHRGHPAEQVQALPPRGWNGIDEGAGDTCNTQKNQVLVQVTAAQGNGRRSDHDGANHQQRDPRHHQRHDSQILGCGRHQSASSPPVATLRLADGNCATGWAKHSPRCM